jgi:hypothetical protein
MIDFGASMPGRGPPPVAGTPLTPKAPFGDETPPGAGVEKNI